MCVFSLQDCCELLTASEFTPYDPTQEMIFPSQLQVGTLYSCIGSPVKTQYCNFLRKAAIITQRHTVNGGV